MRSTSGLKNNASVSDQAESTKGTNLKTPTQKATLEEDGHKTVLELVDKCFGVYFISLAILVGYAAYNHQTKWQGFVFAAFFPIVNLLLSQVSLRLHTPKKFEIFRALLNCFFASLGFIMVDGVFDPFWINFVVLSLGQSIVLTSITSNPNHGKAMAPLNVILMFLTAFASSFFSGRIINWYQFTVYAGLVSMLGLFISLTVDVLLQSLRREHERTKELQESQMNLKEIQKTMLSNAHKAGMAEIATGILHNVGNILNSVNIGADRIYHLTKNEKLETFETANTLVKENKSKWGDFFLNDPKGSKIFDFYFLLKAALASDFKLLKKETVELQKNIQLIKDIINLQQDFAKGIESKEEVFLQEVVETVLAMQTTSYIKRNIKVLRNFSEVKSILGQKSKLTHVLFNLCKNAIEAMNETEIDKKVLTIEIGTDQKHEVFIKISDTGSGIAHENLNKIFNHGFTTKKTGHGFGLHSCSSSLTEMDGCISVQSGGIGKGATFTITFKMIGNQESARSA